MGVTGVEAEADSVPTFGLTDRVPQPSNAIKTTSHGIVPTSGVLNQQRHAHVQAVDALAPIVEANGRIVVLQHMPAVHDEPFGANLGGSIQVLLNELPARDSDPVVGSRHIEHVRRMDIEPDAGLLGGGLKPCRAAGVPDLRTLPCLRVPEEELRQGGAAGCRLGNGIHLITMSAYLQC